MNNKPSKKRRLSVSSSSSSATNNNKSNNNDTNHKKKPKMETNLTTLDKFTTPLASKSSNGSSSNLIDGLDGQYKVDLSLNRK